jgi:hypothetical protein
MGWWSTYYHRTFTRNRIIIIMNWLVVIMDAYIKNYHMRNEIHSLGFPSMIL